MAFSSSNDPSVLENGRNTWASGHAAALAALALGTATILGALGFQYLGGYLPCELCYGQRWPYYLGLPLLLLLTLAWSRLHPAARALGLGLVGLVFMWSTYLGGFHAGVEWGWWPGPTACSGGGAAAGGLNFEDLGEIDATRVVACDVPSWRFLGISFAGYNAAISMVIAALLLWAGFRQFRHTAARS